MKREPSRASREGLTNPGVRWPPSREEPDPPRGQSGKVGRLEESRGDGKHARQTRGTLGTLRAADRTHPRVCVSPCPIGALSVLIRTHGSPPRQGHLPSFLPSLGRSLARRADTSHRMRPFFLFLACDPTPRVGRGSIIVSAFGIFGNSLGEKKNPCRAGYNAGYNASLERDAAWKTVPVLSLGAPGGNHVDDVSFETARFRTIARKCRKRSYEAKSDVARE